MTYEEVKEYLPSATYLYIDVTNEEYDNIPVASYITSVNDIAIAGTNIEIVELSHKELKKGLTSFM